MPYQVTNHITDSGVTYEPSTVVSDELGLRLGAEHPNSLVRIGHDNDLCVVMVDGCEHESHNWNTPVTPPALNPAKQAPIAPAPVALSPQPN